MQRILTAAVVLAGALAAADAHAQWGGPGYGGYGFGYGYSYNGYSIYDQDRLPYFALHPPVYYSYPPVPRTFGYSPFAYPGWIQTPEYADADPQTITNPYFDQGTTPVAPGIEASPVIPGTPATPGTPKAAPPAIKKSQYRATPGADRSVEAQPLRLINPHFGPLVSLKRE
jgi:hypothetical protein